MAETRWEYRAWFEDQAHPVSALAAAGEAGEALYRTDTYLLPSDPALSAKLRDGRLWEIKRCEQVLPDGPERWSVLVSMPFPVVAEHLAALKLTLTGEGVVAKPDDLVTLLAGAGLRKIPVRKHRRQFMLDGVEAEIAEVLGGGIPPLTVGLECDDADRLMHVARQIGLAEHPNLDYGTALRRAA